MPLQCVQQTKRPQPTVRRGRPGRAGMAHPFCDSSIYPRDRTDARAFHVELHRMFTFMSPGSIDTLPKSCGSNLPPFAWGRVDGMWKEVLEILASAQRLPILGDALQAYAKPAVHKAFEAVAGAVRRRARHRERPNLRGPRRSARRARAHLRQAQQQGAEEEAEHRGRELPNDVRRCEPACHPAGCYCPSGTRQRSTRTSSSACRPLPLVLPSPDPLELLVGGFARRIHTEA